MQVFKNFTELNDQEKTSVVQKVLGSNYFDIILNDLTEFYFDNLVYDFGNNFENETLSPITKLFTLNDFNDALRYSYNYPFLSGWFTFNVSLDFNDKILKLLNNSTQKFIESLKNKDYEFFISFNPQNKNINKSDFDIEDQYGNYVPKCEINQNELNEAISDIQTMLNVEFDKILGSYPVYEDILSSEYDYFKNDDSALIEELEARDPLIDNDYNVVHLSYNSY